MVLKTARVPPLLFLKEAKIGLQVYGLGPPDGGNAIRKAVELELRAGDAIQEGVHSTLAGISFREGRYAHGVGTHQGFPGGEVGALRRREGETPELERIIRVEVRGRLGKAHKESLGRVAVVARGLVWVEADEAQEAMEERRALVDRCASSCLLDSELVLVHLNQRRHLRWRQRLRQRRRRHRPFGTHEFQQPLSTPSLSRIRLFRCWLASPLRVRGASICLPLGGTRVHSTIGFHW